MIIPPSLALPCRTSPRPNSLEAHKACSLMSLDTSNNCGTEWSLGDQSVRRQGQTVLFLVLCSHSVFMHIVIHEVPVMQ